jgi:hypothetical protein
VPHHATPFEERVRRAMEEDAAGHEAAALGGSLRACEAAAGAGGGEGTGGAGSDEAAPLRRVDSEEATEVNRLSHLTVTRSH